MSQPSPPRRLVRAEVLVVLALSLGASAAYSVLALVRDELRGPLRGQTTSLVTSAAPNSWLDLAYQLTGIATALAPVALVVLLVALRRRPDPVKVQLGLPTDRALRDLARGAAVAAVVGGAGLVAYLVARELGLAVTVVPSRLPEVWWRIPVLVLSAVQNGVLEEVVLLGWLLPRLRELDWPWGRAVIALAVLRGSYHLYQGYGAFAGNLVMGLAFAWLARRWGRVTPLVWAHCLIDTVAFVGAVVLAGQVSFLPA